MIQIDWWTHLGPGGNVHLVTLTGCEIIAVVSVEPGRVHLANGSQINRVTHLNYHPVHVCTRGTKT